MNLDVLVVVLFRRWVVLGLMSCDQPWLGDFIS